MKVLICGSRDWNDGTAIYMRVSKLPGDAEIITGGARGADTIAERAARDTRRPCTVFHANWDDHGRKAGILRNLRMLDYGPDLVIAFQRAGSRGTQHTINEARKRGIPVEVITP